MRSRTLISWLGITISVTSTVSAIFLSSQVYSQTNTSLLGNNSGNASLGINNGSNATTINIRLANDQNSQNNSIYSNALTALVGAGGALSGSALTYITATRTSKSEKQKQKKYNISLREIVLVEFEKYAETLTSIKKSITQTSGGYYFFEYDKLHKNLMIIKSYYKKSIVYSLPLERKAEAFDPKTIPMIDYQIINDINVNIIKSRTRPYTIWPLDLQVLGI